MVLGFASRGQSLKKMVYSKWEGLLKPLTITWNT